MGDIFLSVLSSFRSFLASLRSLNVQTQLAEYGQLKPGQFLVIVAGHEAHNLLKFAATAQAAEDSDWCPSRGWYPVGDGNLTALTCLDILSYCNRKCMNFT